MIPINISCSSDCCSTDNKEGICPVVLHTGHSVKEITVKQFPKKLLENYSDFYFCENKNCDVIYFKNNGFILKKNDVNVLVGIKEGKGLLCYCFNKTVEEVKENKEKVIEEIKKNIKELGCECEIKNPSGRCCLTDIKSFH